MLFSSSLAQWGWAGIWIKNLFMCNNILKKPETGFMERKKTKAKKEKGKSKLGVYSYMKNSPATNT